MYFCEYCFRYTNLKDADLTNHIENCYMLIIYFQAYVYIGDEYLIKKFPTQTHALFSQMYVPIYQIFLDNKSSSGNIEEFEFYVLYAKES